MKTVGVLANCLKPHAPEVLRRVARKAAALKMALVAYGDTADHLPEATRLTLEEFAPRIDVLMALGGDGTMLKAVRTLDKNDVPLIGVNLGSLGFMTSVAEEHLEIAMESLAEGNYQVSARTLAECEVRRAGRTRMKTRALNDVVIGWGASARVVVLELSINEEEVTSYMCDGLIISTPTGSTGHSLSAMGPILHPETGAFLVNVICPHALSARTLVIPDDRVIKVTVLSMPDAKNLLLSVDGQSEETFDARDELIVGKSPVPARFIHLPGYSYFNLLRQKLHWRGSSY
jgi:NAD+ kinase